MYLRCPAIFRSDYIMSLIAKLHPDNRSITKPHQPELTTRDHFLGTIFSGLIDYLHNVFQLGETPSTLKEPTQILE